MLQVIAEEAVDVHGDAVPRGAEREYHGESDEDGLDCDALPKVVAHDEAHCHVHEVVEHFKPLLLEKKKKTKTKKKNKTKTKKKKGRRGA